MTPAKPKAEAGNTPTRVGKTSQSANSDSISEKHPHACGEDQRHAQPPALVEETPPRVWGRLRVRLCAERRLRNTPTRVGKTDG